MISPSRRTRTSSICLGLVVVAVTATGCGSSGFAPSAPAGVVTSASPSLAAGSGAAGGTAGGAAGGAAAGIVTVPGSGHVSGVYPARCHAVDGGQRPDPTCTPGAVQETVTQATIRSTICRHGWTATVRASEAETTKVKKAAMLAYGEPASTSSTTELDHFVPLELGGANDVRNLWPEPSDEPGRGVGNSKDQVENHLNAAVCRGQVGLVAAQQAIAADWTTAERMLGLTG